MRIIDGSKIMFFYSTQVDVSQRFVKLGCIEILIFEHRLKIFNSYLLAEHLYTPSPFTTIDYGSFIVVELVLTHSVSALGNISSLHVIFESLLT